MTIETNKAQHLNTLLDKALLHLKDVLLAPHTANERAQLVSRAIKHIQAVQVEIIVESLVDEDYSND